jgi:hypothetical protein
VRRLGHVLAAAALLALSGSPAGSVSAQSAARGPLAISSRNPHYLEYRGKPVVLISSAEHYGAAINLDFDVIPYLKELERQRLNQTRVFTGFYVEDSSAFRITDNTLAPRPLRYIAAWPRSSEPGYANGGNKFDLSKWDPNFFTRLNRYVAEAARRDVIVEIVLFCPFYNDAMWRISPVNPANNINGIGAGLTREQIYHLKDATLTLFQDAYVRKIVTELNGFDNIYYELVNEPYANQLVPEVFERHMAEVIVETEKNLPKRHLIAQGISNGSRKIENPHPAVSIFNFHYASPPTTVGLNAGLRKVIADDETGFRGQGDLPYRLEAWHFLLAGGGSFSHLDYSFTTAHPSGTWVPLPPNQPGGGGPDFRRQMRVLAVFMNGFDFAAMTPRDDVLDRAALGNLEARALVEEGRQYAVYLSIADPTRNAPGGRQTEAATASFPTRDVTLPVQMPAGRYEARWIVPITGQTAKRETFDHQGGRRPLVSPTFSTDVALRIARIGK